MDPPSVRGFRGGFFARETLSVIRFFFFLFFLLLTNSSSLGPRFPSFFFHFFSFIVTDATRSFSLPPMRLRFLSLPCDAKCVSNFLHISFFRLCSTEFSLFATGVQCRVVDLSPCNSFFVPIPSPFLHISFSFLRTVTSFYLSDLDRGPSDRRGWERSEAGSTFSPVTPPMGPTGFFAITFPFSRVCPTTFFVQFIWLSATSRDHPTSTPRVPGPVYVSFFCDNQIGACVFSAPVVLKFTRFTTYPSFLRRPSFRIS